MKPWHWVRMIATGAMLVGMLVTTSAHADREIPSVLVVSKSENKNQVHYGVRVDGACGFASSTPVYAYWRMLERGPHATEPLLDREAAAYGIARQEVRGDVVRIVLRALPSRQITLRLVRATDGACTAVAETTIDSRPARLFNVHVALGFLRVDHLLLTGRAESDGRLVRERVTL